MTPKKQVSPVIRISQGERDASARATHLEAATRKFLVTTNERKQMSTTTNFKRIALVAVAALGFGVLSAIPSSAAVSGVTVTITNGATPLAAGSTTRVDSDTGTATGATISIGALITAATDSVTVAFYNKNTLSTSGLAYLGLVDTTTGVISQVGTRNNGLGSHSSAKTVGLSAGFGGTTGTIDSSTAGVTTFGLSSSTGTGNVGARFALFLDTKTAVGGAGTYTYSVVVTTRTVNAGAVSITEYTNDVSIVVSANASTAAAAALTPSAVYTTFFAGPGAGTKSVETALSSGSATASTTALAGFTLNVKNAADAAAAQDTVTATVSGPGLIFDGTSYGKSIVKFQTGSLNWGIVPDGNAGVATVTFKTSITGLTYTRTVTFYAAKAGTITASVFSPVLQVGPNTAAVAVTAKDANGIAWTGALSIYASSAADALVAGTVAPEACGDYNPDTGLILCPVTGTTLGTAKLKVIDSTAVATANATSNEVTVTVKSATASSVKLAFNKASYAPGEKALLTVTPVAADGTNLPAATYSALLASGGITSSVQLGAGSDTLTATSITTSAYSSATSNLVAGAKTYVVYMPATGGTVKVTATGSTSLPIGGQVEVSASATVTDNAAAALAAVNALATTVASLRTLITTLTNLVLKIQKKVKA